MFSKKLIIIDRDGCLNQPSSTISIPYVFETEKFIVYEDVIEFFKMAKLYDCNFAIATNQRGISLGYYSQEDVDSLHARLLSLIEVSPGKFPIFTCPHDPKIHSCTCRKPQPGLLVQALEFHGNSVSESVFIGDSKTDYEASRAIGMDFVWLNRKGLGVSHADYVYTPFMLGTLDFELMNGWFN